MKIELKSLRISLAMSEETTAFTADVYINGVKAGYAKNQGCGGSTSTNPYEGFWTTLQAAEKHLAENTKEETFDGHLNDFIDNLVYAELQNKEKEAFEKKLQKATVNGIVWGVKGGMEFNVLRLKKPFTIAQLNQVQITNLLSKVTLKANEVILNKNLSR